MQVINFLHLEKKNTSLSFLKNYFGFYFSITLELLWLHKKYSEFHVTLKRFRIDLAVT